MCESATRPPRRNRSQHVVEHAEGVSRVIQGIESEGNVKGRCPKLLDNLVPGARNRQYGRIKAGIAQDAHVSVRQRIDWHDADPLAGIRGSHGCKRTSADVKNPYLVGHSLIHCTPERGTGDLALRIEAI